MSVLDVKHTIRLHLASPLYGLSLCWRYSAAALRVRAFDRPITIMVNNQ